MNFRIQLFLTLLFSTLCVEAQKADFHFYTVADGMPQNGTYRIGQDQQGFIWLNHGGYLSRFDGSQFKAYTNSTHPAFKQYWELGMNFVIDGAQLYFTQGGKIMSINTHSGVLKQVASVNLPLGVEAIAGHFIKFDKSGIVVAYPAPKANRVYLYWFKGGKINKEIVLQGVYANRDRFFEVICTDQQGHLYTLDKEATAVLRFDQLGRPQGAYAIHKNPNSIFRMIVLRNNAVLLSAGNHLMVLPNGAEQFQEHPLNRLLQPSQEPFYDLEETPQGDLWICGANRSLYQYSLQTGQLYNYQKQVEQNIQHQTTLSCLLLDQAGTLWSTTSIGLLKIEPKTSLFAAYFTEADPACGGYCSFRGFAEDEQKRVYASFYNNVFLIDPKQKTTAYQSMINGVYSPFGLVHHQPGLVLCNGLVYNLSSKRIENPFQIPPELSNCGVFCHDNQGRLWWAQQGRILLLEHGHWVTKKELHSQASPFTDFVYDPHSQKMWLCNEHVLWSLDPETLKIKYYPGGKNGENLRPKCIYPDGRGKIWLGTEQGLIKFDYKTNAQERYTQLEGLANNIVVGILPEGDSCLWVATFNGLSRLNVRTKKFINFYKEDGLADNEFNRGSFFKASDGRCYFGGVKGVSAFYPREVMRQYTRLQRGERLQLRSISLTKTGSDSIQTLIFQDSKQALDIYHEDLTLSFEYGVFDPRHNGQNQYSYWMDGLGHNWSPPSSNASVTFSRLPAGHYTFRVKALNARGDWLPEKISLPIVVHPPWWATWWAYTFYVLGAIGMGYGVFVFLKKRWDLQNQLQLEQQEALRLKDLDQFKSRLYTNLTHEFRTPLTVILGMADQLEEKELNKGNQIAGGLIKKNAQSLLQLINQLLDLSKLEEHSLKLHLQGGDLVAFLRYASESFQSLANSRNLSLRFYSSLEKLEVLFDQEQMQQILGNLLSNALKFTPSGGHIQVKLNVQDEAWLAIKVIDTGIGIPAEALGQVFDRFFQVEGSQSLAGSGTGIGLSHTRELVNLMGGNISVSSRVGQGTEFTVLLPLVQAEESSSAAFSYGLPLFNADNPVVQLNLNEQFSDLPTLLLIEDNPDVVYYLKSVLTDYYTISLAYNGRIGIEMAFELIPDLILSDVMMPECDGYTVLDTLKNDVRSSHIPIVLLTAKADVASKIDGLRRGADAYLPKPFDKNELLVTLEMMKANRERQKHYFAQKYTQSGTTEATITEEPLAASESQLEDAFLQKIQTIITENYTEEDFGLPQLCQKIGLSRYQLFRKMKALTAVSPSDFIRNYRLNEAKKLLQHSKKSVKEVAFQVGFKDVPHFTRSYQELFGNSPSATRK